MSSVTSTRKDIGAELSAVVSALADAKGVDQLTVAEAAELIKKVKECSAPTSFSQAVALVRASGQQEEAEKALELKWKRRFDQLTKLLKQSVAITRAEAVEWQNEVLDYLPTKEDAPYVGRYVDLCVRLCAKLLRVPLPAPTLGEIVKMMADDAKKVGVDPEAAGGEHTKSMKAFVDLQLPMANQLNWSDTRENLVTVNAWMDEVASAGRLPLQRWPTFFAAMLGQARPRMAASVTKSSVYFMEVFQSANVTAFEIQGSVTGQGGAKLRVDLMDLAWWWRLPVYVATLQVPAARAVATDPATLEERMVAGQSFGAFITAFRRSYRRLNGGSDPTNELVWSKLENKARQVVVKHLAERIVVWVEGLSEPSELVEQLRKDVAQRPADARVERVCTQLTLDELKSFLAYQDPWVRDEQAKWSAPGGSGGHGGGGSGGGNGGGAGKSAGKPASANPSGSDEKSSHSGGAGASQWPCHYCKKVGHKWRQCSLKPPGWKPDIAAAGAPAKTQSGGAAKPSAGTNVDAQVAKAVADMRAKVRAGLAALAAEEEEETVVVSAVEGAAASVSSSASASSSSSSTPSAAQSKYLDDLVEQLFAGVEQAPADGRKSVF
jgi:hypothetical protein